MTFDENARERQARLYAKLWKTRTGDWASADLIRHRVWRPFLAPPVLDVGAGDGVLARCHPDLDIVSVDLTSAGLVKVRDRGAAVGAAERLPFKANTFATVVLSEVLEHVENPVETLEECHRVLRPNGLLLLSVPMMPLAAAESAYHRLRTGQTPTLDNLAVWDSNHERRFTLPELKELLAGPRWAIEHIQPLFRTPTTFAMYYLEPRLMRLLRRQEPVRIAHRLERLDRLLFHAAASGVGVVVRAN